MDLFTAGQGIGRRFQIVTVVPTLVLELGTLLILSTGGWRGEPSLHIAVTRAEGLTATGVASIAFAGVAAALVTHPLQVRLVKMFEGYLRPSNPIVRYGLARHSRILHHHRRLAVKLDADERELIRRFRSGETVDLTALESCRRRAARHALIANSYPDRNRLMPTLLGNRLRAAEDHAGDRYGIAAVSFMPYVYAVMPAAASARIQDGRNELDTSVRLTAMFLVLTVLSVVVFANDSWWLAWPLVFYILAATSYRAAVNAATGYGKMLARAIDLHRFLVLDAMSWPRPFDVKSERALFSQLREFVAGSSSGDMADVRYHHTVPGSTSEMSASAQPENLRAAD